MTRRDHAGDKPCETDGSAPQPGADEAADPTAATQARPDGKAGGRVKHGEAVWDQHLPWVTPGDEDHDLSAPQAQPPRGEPAAGEESTTVQVDTGTGDEAGGAQSEARTPAEDEAAVAAVSPVPEAPQPADSQRSRNTKAKPDPLSARAVGSPAARRLLGVTVAVGGLLAAVGGAVAFHPSPSAKHVKQEAAPIAGPADDGDAVTPTPSATGHAATHVGNQKPHPPALHVVESTPMAKAFAVGKPAGDHATRATSTVDQVSQPLAPATTEQRVQQQSYLSVSTSVYTQNPYWSQSSVTLTTKTELTALKIAVRIDQTGGVLSTGTWTSLGDRVTVTSAADSQELDYVMTLKPGVTVKPGTYTFEFQYNHHEGTRDTSHDLFTVTATAPGSAGTESKQGHF